MVQAEERYTFFKMFRNRRNVINTKMYGRKLYVVLQDVFHQKMVDTSIPMGKAQDGNLAFNMKKPKISLFHFQYPATSIAGFSNPLSISKGKVKFIPYAYRIAFTNANY
ncbi:predicted protein [Sclerotinia sclerotiorum 1980 UF-70]|uniref:Uncharacterized protein n=1 Tax=Sclerotinia sclerotiorum (strain ATCC 18683 / 1980 / Ss-1) TaxID=665079 RepID=A7EMF1_SCLS1|nr:predicted protein [Sclerotinia sclerotiorum 1980 UF-70]EDO04017.1 predicted protein [Sclerotinia sclerotiorum 1980 UF-70]